MTVSVLVHYFTLVAVMWMGAEALLMFQKLVIVFVRITTKFIVTVSIICWSKCNVRLIGLCFSLFLETPLINNHEMKKRDRLGRPGEQGQEKDTEHCFLYKAI